MEAACRIKRLVWNNLTSFCSLHIVWSIGVLRRGGRGGRKEEREEGERERREEGGGKERGGERGEERKEGGEREEREGKRGRNKGGEKHQCNSYMTLYTGTCTIYLFQWP